jgi:uncharacterized membrane protein
VLIILLSVALIIALLAILRLIAKHHKRKIAIERAKRMTAIHILKLLAVEMRTAYYARDYYRSALEQIILVTRADDEAGGIARRFMQADAPHEEDAT